MGAATVISQSLLENIQLNAGVLLSSFTPSNPAITAANIICATTGGINASCVPTFVDYGEDIDNCPNNTKEMKRINGWDCKFSTTCLGVSVNNLKMALGAADVTALESKITPRGDIDSSDFTASVWWVGDRSDGGLVAIELKNSLSTGGLVLQTTKNGKGGITLELTGHVAIADASVVPMEFYSLDPNG